MASGPPFRRLLIANRGEIALRVMRTCRELGIETVAVYSDADAEALHVRAADRAQRIGPAAPSQSYLSIDAILDAARVTGADAIHPGYGFLSEHAPFARAVEEAGIGFVGPPAATLAMLGNKLAARQAAQGAGVPVVPGLSVAVEGDGSGAGVGVELVGIGFPLVLKAAAGGGGRGMRLVASADQLAGALVAARREALSAFGDGTIYAERLVVPARHVEVQLLGDRHGNLAVLGERECSVQRRYQKLVEESPSPAVTPSLREALFQSARRVASTVEFHNAATVEFLLDAAGGHYFLEMNTRLQVEHGVTELVTGLDLVAWQIRVAAGERLPVDVLEVATRGHAIQARLYAEDPWDGFRPSPGRVTTWRMAAGPGVRVDAGIEGGTELPPAYDPLLAKLLVHAADRPAAVARLRRALDETLIGGLQTDLGFVRWLVDDAAFGSGDYDTSLIAERWGGGSPIDEEERGLAALAAAAARSQALEARGAGGAPGTRGTRGRRGTAPEAAMRPGESAWSRRAREEGLRR